ncbi:hypothetical protein [Mucilaginibacter paludis]|uniref:hypothetical protein n=1 Tax=Mucilaginibacter paludis TaxID=423351 RepID=UPI00145E5E86|nr:hypothetical protein [Mucilaginibacter paludis]
MADLPDFFADGTIGTLQLRRPFRAGISVCIQKAVGFLTGLMSSVRALIQWHRYS